MAFSQLRIRFDAWQESLDEYVARDLSRASAETRDSAQVSRDSVNAILARLDRVDAMVLPKVAALAIDSARTDSSGAFVLTRTAARYQMVVIRTRPLSWTVIPHPTKEPIGADRHRVMTTCEGF